MLSKGFKYTGVHTVDGRNAHVIENKRNSANEDNWDWKKASFSFVRRERPNTGLFKCRQTGEYVQLRIKH